MLFSPTVATLSFYFHIIDFITFIDPVLGLIINIFSRRMIPQLNFRSGYLHVTYHERLAGEQEEHEE